jgi:hypothetical protein
MELARNVPQDKRRQFILSTQALYPRSAEGPASPASDKTQAAFHVRRVYLAGIAHCPMGALKDDWEARGILFRNEILNLDWITQQQGASSILEVVLVQGAEERFLTGISHLSCSILPYPSAVQRRDTGQRFIDRVSRICRTSKSTRARDFYQAWRQERTTPPPPPPPPQPAPTSDDVLDTLVRAACKALRFAPEEGEDLAIQIVGSVTDPAKRAALRQALQGDDMVARAALEPFMDEQDDPSDGDSDQVMADRVDDTQLLLPAPHAAYHTVE